MGVSGKTKADRDRYSEDDWQNTDQTTNTNSNTNSNTSSNNSGFTNTSSNSLLQNQGQSTDSTDATFNSPQGQAILNALTGNAASGQVGQGLQESANIYSRLGQGGINPYTEDLIKDSNIEAEKNFSNRLAQTRAGAYRGGTAANIGKQGQLAADFSAQQGASNATLRQGAFDSGQTLALGAAGGLGSLANQQQSLGTQLLALLRGENTSGTNASTQSSDTYGTQAGAGSSNSNTQTQQQVIEQLIAALTGGKSGTKSNTSAEIDGGYGINYG